LISFYEEYGKTYKNEEKFIEDVPLSNPERVKDMLPFIKSPVLDVGCSRGHDTNYFYKKGFEIEGCDISRNVLTEAKKLYHKINFFWCDFENSPPKKKYNSILALDIIDHVFDCDKFLKNAGNCLEDNGIIILAFPNALSLQNRIKFLFGDSTYFYFFHFPHIRFFGADTIKVLLERNNFKLIKLFGYSRFPLPNKLKGVFTVIAIKKRKINK